ncbi:helix-turn-helix domain-containing protein [Alienimonas sp. DA493]|uniref:helix-turn-helix domain-containing protein n=1 Tax=Alienimonas sp. DA493 TaxID=3373605 RepID=UPI0037547B9A
MRTIYTTGQVAKHCQVAPRVVVGWFDAGHFKGGYRLPHRDPDSDKPGDRRIPREALIAFLEKNGMPLDGLAEPEGRGAGLCVTVGMPPDGDDDLSSLLDGMETRHVATFLDLGLTMDGQAPAAVVLDFRLGSASCVSAGYALRQKFPGAVLVALLNPEDGLYETSGRPFDATVRRPFDAAALAERVKTLAARKREAA